MINNKLILRIILTCYSPLRFSPRHLPDRYIVVLLIFQRGRDGLRPYIFQQVYDSRHGCHLGVHLTVAFFLFGVFEKFIFIRSGLHDKSAQHTLQLTLPGLTSIIDLLIYKRILQGSILIFTMTYRFTPVRLISPKRLTSYRRKILPQRAMYELLINQF